MTEVGDVRAEIDALRQEFEAFQRQMIQLRSKDVETINSLKKELIDLRRAAQK